MKCTVLVILCLASARILACNKHHWCQLGLWSGHRASLLLSKPHRRGHTGMTLEQPPGRPLVLPWSVYGSASDLLLVVYWSGLDLLLVVYWLSIGCLLFCLWSSNGCLLVSYWSATDLPLVYWLSIGLLLIFHWSIGYLLVCSWSSIDLLVIYCSAPGLQVSIGYLCLTLFLLWGVSRSGKYNTYKRIPPSVWSCPLVMATSLTTLCLDSLLKSDLIRPEYQPTYSKLKISLYLCQDLQYKGICKSLLIVSATSIDVADTQFNQS